MESTVFWVIIPCNLLRVNRRFGGTGRLQLQGRRITRTRYQLESRRQADVGFSFDPEVGGDMFLRNVG
jgi:hypothetical protein